MAGFGSDPFGTSAFGGAGATFFQAGFEVAPSGTPIPLTGGGDGFNDGGNFSTGGTFASDSTVPAAVASGTYCAKITTGSTGDWMFRGWNITGAKVFHRAYFYLTAYPSVSISLAENFTTQVSPGPTSRLRLSSGGKLGLSVGSGSTTDATTAIPLNTLVRIETSFDHSAGSMSVDAYLAHSTTPISGASVSLTGLTFGGASLRETILGIVGYVSSYTLRTDAWAVSDTARPGPLLLGSTVAGVTAQVVVQAAGGSAVGGTGGPVSVVGQTAVVVVEGGNRPVPPAPPAVDVLWPPDPYRQSVRSGGLTLTYIVDASYGGAPVVGAQDLRPVGGTITDTTKPGVRRVLNLELPPTPGLFELLSPIGITLSVTCRVMYMNRQTFDIPMGVFDVDSETLSEGDGGISLTAPDKWVRVQRARFLGPGTSTPGLLVVDEIAQMIKDALGSSEPVAVSATSQAVMGAQVWEKDRGKAILDLAAGIGAWVFFDRNGLATIADIPTIGASADWLIDASPSGVLVELDRSRSRANTYNVVVVESSSTDSPFATQIVWDTDVNSPTYAGTNPMYATGAGPFGVVTYYHDTPLPLGNAGAAQAGRTILARVTGLASQVSLGQVPNPAVDAFDVIDVLPPRERADIARVLERHVVDTVTHPLSLGPAQHIEGRSTRTDEFA